MVFRQDLGSVLVLGNPRAVPLQNRKEVLGMPRRLGGR